MQYELTTLYEPVDTTKYLERWENHQKFESYEYSNLYDFRTLYLAPNGLFWMRSCDRPRIAPGEFGPEENVTAELWTPNMAYNWLKDEGYERPHALQLLLQRTD